MTSKAVVVTPENVLVTKDIKHIGVSVFEIITTICDISEIK